MISCSHWGMHPVPWPFSVDLSQPWWLWDRNPYDEMQAARIVERELDRRLIVVPALANGGKFDLRPGAVNIIR